MTRRQPSDAEFERRREVWRHNSYRGHARMMMTQAQAILASPTTTDEARDLARDIYAKAADLSHALRERRS